MKLLVALCIPHTPRTMKSLGLDETDVDKFCTDMLFPKINTQ